MLVFSYEVFDDTITATWAASAATQSFYIDVKWNEKLGRADQLAIQLVTDTYTTTGTPSAPSIAVQIEQSSDGLHFQNKNGAAEIAATALSATTIVASGSDSGSSPSQSKVRLRIDLAVSGSSTGSVTVHVKLHATGRDQG